jgi:acetyl-CoA C-acetyltransferase
MPDAMIVATARTPIGRANRGSLAAERPDDLLAFAIRAALDRVPELGPEHLDDVIAGCGYPEQEQGFNVARRASLLAGLPVSVPGVTVSRFCASSLQAARMAFHAIRAGEGEAFVVGGVESVSRTDRTPRAPGERHPRLSDGEGSIHDVHLPMGLTAENVADRYDVPREDMDRYAQRSQERAVAAAARGFFEREIVPYPTAAGTVVSHDDGPRPSSTLEKLAALPPVFREDGRVTAGNACPLNDGAAAAVVVSNRLARDLGLKPLARIVATAAAALEPEYMGVGPIGAVRTVLRRAGMTIDDVDVLELNEAFAAQVIPVCEELDVGPFDDRVNPNGGAIALGHPFGMTGVRMLGTLVNALEERDATIGVATMCVAQGQGMAMLVERV